MMNDLQLPPVMDLKIQTPTIIASVDPLMLCKDAANLSRGKTTNEDIEPPSSPEEVEEETASNSDSGDATEDDDATAKSALAKDALTHAQDVTTYRNHANTDRDLGKARDERSGRFSSTHVVDSRGREAPNVDRVVHEPLYDGESDGCTASGEIPSQREGDTRDAQADRIYGRVARLGRNANDCYAAPVTLRPDELTLESVRKALRNTKPLGE